MKRWLAVVLAWFVPVLAVAADVRIELSADQLAVGQHTTFDVVLQGARARGLPDVRAENGLTVAYAGSSQTTTIINGRLQQYVKYRYDLLAREEGSWRLGPVYVTVDEQGGTSRTLVASPVQVVVVPPGHGTAPQGPIDVDAAFDVKEAWQGQVVIYRSTLRTRRQIAAAAWRNAPQAGLMVPKDGHPESREYVVRDAQGAVLVHEEWQPYVVTSSGQLRWGAPVLEADLVSDAAFRLFPRTTRELVSAQPLSLDVRPLPPAPSGFSGLVGDFQLTSRVDKTVARVGESVTWAVTLEGSGSLEGYQLPPVPETDGVRIYTGGTRGRAATRRGEFVSSVTYERTLVPTREGELEIPPVEIVVFSPRAGQYVTLTTPTSRLRVTAGEVGALDVTSFGERIETEDAVDDGPRPFRTSGPALRVPWERVLPVGWALAAAPALLVAGSAVAARARAFVEARRRATTREATPLERLDRLPDDPRERLVALDEALRLAVARATGTPVAELDRRAAVRALPPDLGARVSEVTVLVDRARFGGDLALPTDLEPRVRDVVASLETV